MAIVKYTDSNHYWVAQLWNNRAELTAKSRHNGTNIDNFKLPLVWCIEKSTWLKWKTLFWKYYVNFSLRDVLFFLPLRHRLSLLSPLLLFLLKLLFVLYLLLFQPFLFLCLVDLGFFFKTFGSLSIGNRNFTCFSKYFFTSISDKVYLCLFRYEIAEIDEVVCKCIDSLTTHRPLLAECRVGSLWRFFWNLSEKPLVSWNA